MSSKESEQTCAILLTNQEQNLNQQWLRAFKFPALGIDLFWMASLTTRLSKTNKSSPRDLPMNSCRFSSQILRRNNTLRVPDNFRVQSGKTRYDTKVAGSAGFYSSLKTKKFSLFEPYLFSGNLCPSKTTPSFSSWL